MKAVLLLACLVIVQVVLAGAAPNDRKLRKSKDVKELQKKKEESSKKQSKSSKSSVTTKEKEVTKKPTTKKPTTKKPTTKKPTTKVTTKKPTTKVTTKRAVTKVTTKKPVTKVTTKKPVTKVTTKKKPVTKVTTKKPVTKVTKKPVTTRKPTTKIPLHKRKERSVYDHHLDVFHLSNGFQAVALDNSFGNVVDYLYLGTNIHLVPQEGSYFLPATDLLNDHQTFVNLATVNGHLSLSEARIGNVMYQGFKGIDQYGPVFVPVEKERHGLVVKPVVYRMDRLDLYTPPAPPVMRTGNQSPLVQHIVASQHISSL